MVHSTNQNMSIIVLEFFTQVRRPGSGTAPVRLRTSKESSSNSHILQPSMPDEQKPKRLKKKCNALLNMSKTNKQTWHVGNTLRML